MVKNGNEGLKIKEQIKVADKDSIIIDSITTKPSVHKLKVQTPLGSIESDSGSHALDILTIVGVIAVLYVGKKLVDKLVDKFFRRDK